MKIDFSQKILGPDGIAIDDLMLGKVVLGALNAPGTDPIPLDQSIRRGTLALLVANGGEHDITPEDAALIRSLLPQLWTPVIVARAAAMLA